jgi:two-component system cell cycle sensor histidine kinase/response regulator CckA
LEKRDWDVVIADYQLPAFDAPAALIVLQQTGLDLPFFVVSGHIGEETAAELMRAGAKDFVMKRNFARLAPAVERELGDARVRRERRRAQQRLDTSQALLQSLANATVDRVYLKDPAGRYLLANSAVARDLNKPVEDLLGRDDTTLFQPADAAVVMKSDRKVMASRAIETVEEEIANAAGERRIYLSTKGPIFDRGGEIAGVFGISRDITDMRRAEEEKRQLEAQLQQAQKLESIGRLAGGIAHDFNNLLTVINGYTALELRRLAPDDPLHGSLTEVLRAGEQAAAMTGQLLAFSRQRAIQPKPVDCNELLGGNRNMFQRLVGEDVQLVVRPAESIACVMADPGQLVQVLLNLAVNARDAMPSGGTLTMETASIEVTQNTAAAYPGIAPGPYVELIVTDTGTGMDRETRERIFDPFFTTKPVGKGTGLGLSTVYGILRQCGGFIRVDSEPGRGSRFTIYLPRWEGAYAEPPAPVPEPVAAQGVETILVVEDQQNVRGIISEILRRSGYQVLEATDGGEALLICESHPGPIHLVLTDVVMPGMNGRDLARRIEPLKPGAKVLFMSGYTGGVIDNVGAPGAGFAHLQKPFTPESLARKVRQTLDAPWAAPCILVADDSDPIRNIFSHILTGAGYSVVEAADGAQTRERLRAGGIGLALIDLHMPGQNGLEDIRKLRSEHPEVKIVLMSAAFGTGSPGDPQQALGMDAVLGKPAQPEVLLDVVRRLLAPRPGSDRSQRV